MERRLLRLTLEDLVDIRFTSTLTPEDENIMAPAVLKALVAILDLLPIAYMIRIDTVDAQVYQHSGPSGQLMQSERGLLAAPLSTSKFDS